MRKAILAASIAAAACASAFSSAVWAEAKPEEGTPQAAGSQEAGAPVAAQLRVTAPPDASPNRSYDDAAAALLQADIDYLVREGRRAVARNDTNGLWYAAAFSDALVAGRYSDARNVLSRAPGGIDGAFADMLEPFLIAAEGGRIDRAVERVDEGAASLPSPLPEVARALLFESAGRLQEAAAVYALMVEGLDTTPPGEAEPQTTEEFNRALNAARTTHAVYRAALVSHRLGRTEEARRYYNIVLGFAPRAVDVQANLARLDGGQPP